MKLIALADLKVATDGIGYQIADVKTGDEFECPNEVVALRLIEAGSAKNAEQKKAVEAAPENKKLDAAPKNKSVGKQGKK